MNHTCSGDVYSLNGVRHIRCLRDGRVAAVTSPEVLVCPLCSRAFDGQVRGELPSRSRTLVEVELPWCGWVTHSETDVSPVNKE